jgi:hypothetical protein
MCEAGQRYGARSRSLPLHVLAQMHPSPFDSFDLFREWARAHGVPRAEIDRSVPTPLLRASVDQLRSVDGILASVARLSQNDRATVAARIPALQPDLYCYEELDPIDYF